MMKIHNRTGAEILTYHPKSGSDLDPIDLPGVNLERVDLEGKELSEANFEGANLREADLYWAILFRANLKNAPLLRRGKSRDRARVARQFEIAVPTHCSAGTRAAHLDHPFPVCHRREREFLRLDRRGHVERE